ncbi:hypothetical protein DL96DRAFT_1820456 [Flagelloscypha sp. PMI_526]|nr:hypothetical protein DL96DRAFT_1820456 [Flagelloscypha sp. PMI_526]
MLTEVRPSPCLPLELLDHIIGHLSNLKDLRQVCLVAKPLLPSAPRNLYSSITTHLPGNSSTILLRRSLKAAPHLSCYIREVETNYPHSGFLSLVEDLHSDVLRRLVVLGEYPGRMSEDIVESLTPKVLSSIVSLVLHDADVPFSFITSCNQLKRLEMLGGEGILLPAGSGHLNTPQILPLKVLIIDATQSRSGPTSFFTTFLAGGQLPFLEYLELRKNKSPSWLPNTWLPRSDIKALMLPLMTQLTCLDIDLWPRWQAIEHNLNYFSIHNYPNLRIFRMRLGIAEDLYDNESYTEDSARLNWLAQSFQSSARHIH